MNNLIGRGGWAISLYIQLSQRKRPAAYQTTAGAVRVVGYDRAVRDEHDAHLPVRAEAQKPHAFYDFSRAPKQKCVKVLLLILHQRVVTRERSPRFGICEYSLSEVAGRRSKLRQVCKGVGEAAQGAALLDIYLARRDRVSSRKDAEFGLFRRAETGCHCRVES
jgi:hypothetical protein